MQNVSVLISEFVSGGGWDSADTPPASLLAEGTAMWRAIVLDAAACGIDVFTTWDDRQGPPPPLPAGVQVEGVRGGRLVWLDTLQRLASHVGGVFVIAPETDGVLAGAARCLQDRRRGGGPRTGRLIGTDGARCLRWIGASAGVAAVAGDKLLTARWLRSRGVRTPPTWLLADVLLQGVGGGNDDRRTGRWVLKRRDGAGCQPNRLFEATVAELPEALASAACPDWLRDGAGWILQPYVPGDPLSVGVVFTRPASPPRPSSAAPRDVGSCPIVLPPMRQILRESSDALTFLGTRTATGLSRGTQRKLVAHAETIAYRLAGRTCGYLGIDMVVDAKGEVWVVDINPRLCTSYLCYREMYGPRLARAVLLGEPLHAPAAEMDSVPHVAFCVGEAAAGFEDVPARCVHRAGDAVAPEATGLQHG